MMRHRSEPPSQGTNDDASASSSDGDDVFSALSKKRKIGEKDKVSHDTSEGTNTENQTKDSGDKIPQLPRHLPPPTTSSNKRHHGAVSETRKAKMDALLLELEAEKVRKAKEPMRSRREFRPEKKGSFVEPGEEHLTTNIFVGNLSPSITEEQLTDLFRQFGDLYSVKIMWPRNAEERARNRNTGFVCFMNRQDAEDAMEACDEADPFNVGRRIMLRWGKNVKKDDIPIGGVAPILRKPKSTETVQNKSSIECLDERKTIRVIPPDDKLRAHFISLVASYVAKDGSQLERALVEREFQNSEYDFLTLPTDADEKRRRENIFYKWRVYAFCQGDTFHTWRTEPFKMFYPGGCVWIPPPMDIDAARREQESKMEKEKEIERQKQQRKRLHTTTGIKTGRQMEQARKVKPEIATKLTEDELIEFEILFKERLCGSRESICKAMSFCFEKGVAAKQISSLLDDLFVQLRPGISVETIIARFYLISDILFNSQQPGVRNAFMYRDAIEKRAHQWFESVGDFARKFLGRMRVERLASTINTIFAAWASWHVFDPVFMDELQLRFEGRMEESRGNDVETAEETQPQKLDNKIDVDENALEAQVSTEPKGAWTTEPVIDPSNSASEDSVPFHAETVNIELSETNNLLPGLKEKKSVHDIDYSVDADGEPMDDEDVMVRDGSDGVPFDEDADGEPLTSDDADGEPLDDDEVPVDGELLEEDPDGEPLGDDDLG